MRGVFIIAPLFILIVLGVILGRTKFLKPEDKEVFSKLLYWIVLPALLFRTTYNAGGGIWEHKNLFISSYLAMIALPVLAYLISRFITHRSDRKGQALSTMVSARTNNMYLGLPVAVLALGDAGMELGSIYLAIVMPAYNIISILSGEIVLSGTVSAKMIKSLSVKIVKNPLIMASIIGLLFCQIGIPVHDVFLRSMKLLADMATGVALIALGMSLEFDDLLDAVRNTWADVAIKLVLHPAVSLLLFLIWPVDTQMAQTVVLITAMPTAVNSFIIAAGMGMDGKRACQIVAMTTVLSAVTIPLWIYALGLS